MTLPDTTTTLRQAANLHRNGDLSAARRLYTEVLSREPDNAVVLNLAGAAAAQDGNPGEAARLLRRAARLDRHNPIIRVNLAVALAALHRNDAALTALDEAAALAPELPVTHRLRGDLLQAAGRLDAALACYSRASQLQPRDLSIRIQCGNLLAMQDRLAEALHIYEQVIAMDRTNAQAHKQRGVALSLLQRHTEALASLDRAIELSPEFADARYTRASVLLTMGDYARGFAENEWRWHSRLTSSGLERRTFEQPQWLGRESLAGQRILLYSEQGLGDTLQFCRYVKDVAERGATVLLQVQRPLVPLLRQLPGVATLINQDEAAPSFDYHSSLMSLPLAFGTRLENVPAAHSYLQADPARVAAWQRRLGPRRAPRVGLMWNGNSDNPADRYRSFALADWLAHLPSGFDYYSLQRFVRAQDREALRCGVVHDLSTQQSDFDDAAALCACMDLVISVCTSIAHLSGALGQPTWVLLSQHADWRWLLDRTDTPWYPTVRLYRQHKRGDWSDVFMRVAADLDREIR